MKNRVHALTVFLLGSLAGGLCAMALADDPVRASPAITGIGGVFFKADDPARLQAWYREHLGIDAGDAGANFWWRNREDPGRHGRTVWSVFARDSGYFGDTGQQWMINYRVDDLDGLLARLREQGIERVGDIEAYWFGRFAWIVDGEGNRVELWEPADLSPAQYREKMEGR